MLIPFLLCVAFTVQGADQAKNTKLYQIPKFSPSYKRASRDVGPRPGSKVKGGSKQELFKRIYNNPAESRLLVRVPCGTKVGRGQLIARAKKLTASRGPVVQIDWEPIKKGQKVSFWLVTSAQRKIAQIELDGSSGVYKSTDTKDEVQEHWSADPIILSPEACIDEKEVSTKDMRIAVTNILNRFSVDFFRRPSDRAN